ncbi:hypothetical protein CCP4SC76_1570003 [Gammaproteobacteria bacterium]
MSAWSAMGLPSTRNRRAANPSSAPRRRVSRVTAATVSSMAAVSNRHEAAEAHEGQRQDAGRDQRNRVTLPRDRHIGDRDPFPQGGKEYQDQRKSDRGAKTEQTRCHQAPGFMDIEQGRAQHRAVGGNQRQVNAEHLIQPRAGLANHHFGDLHHGGDQGDEDDGLQIIDAQGPQEIGIDQITGHARQGHHEGGGKAHADSGFGSPGNAHEGTQAQEIDQHEVVDQNRADEKQCVLLHAMHNRLVRDGKVLYKALTADDQ